MERLLFADNVALATTPATLAAVNAAGITEGAVALRQRRCNHLESSY